MYEDIKTACLYVRFSSHNQTEQSIEGQTRVCRDFCKRHNIRIVEIYADRATSASKDIEKRVQFLKMIKDSEKGLFDAVIVYKLDRFARSRYDSATYKYRLKRNGVQLISATENISNDPEGIILESVLEGMAEFYSAELSQKINRGMRESAYKHNSIGGAVPLGYKIEDKKLVIDPKTAPIVKEAFEKYADGETVAEICRQFNARGYKTSKGTAFGKSSFTKIFRNERYIGVYSFHDYRAEDAIPAIIDKDLWDRVQLRVGKIKNAPARNKAKVVYLLSGKIFCGHCGSKMNGNCNAGNYCYYQCYGKKNGNVDCKKKNIRKEFIERLVAQDALSLLTDEYIEQIATIACEKNQHEIELDSALPTIRDRIHQVDLSLNHLLKAIESGSAPDMLVKRMGELEKEKKDLQAQAKKESEDIVELDKAQVIYWLEQFRGGSIEDEEFCRMLIDLFVNSVTVWDEDDNTYKVTVAYNLTSLPTKTYRLNKGGTLSDFASNAPLVGGYDLTDRAVDDLPPALGVVQRVDLELLGVEAVHQVDAQRRAARRVAVADQILLLDLIGVCLGPGVVFAGRIIGSVLFGGVRQQFLRHFGAVAVAQRIRAQQIFQPQGLLHHICVCGKCQSSKLLHVPVPFRSAVGRPCFIDNIIPVSCELEQTISCCAFALSCYTCLSCRQHSATTKILYKNRPIFLCNLLFSPSV